MTSSFRHLLLSALNWLALPVFLVLTYFVFLPIGVDAQANHPRRERAEQMQRAFEQRVQNNNRAHEFLNKRFQEPIAAQNRRRMGRQLLAQNGDDSDMPGARMRRKYGKGNEANYGSANTGFGKGNEGSFGSANAGFGKGNEGSFGNSNAGFAKGAGRNFGNGNAGGNGNEGFANRPRNIAGPGNQLRGGNGAGANGFAGRNNFNGQGGQFQGGPGGLRAGMNRGLGAGQGGAGPKGQGGAFGNRPLDLTPLGLNEEQKTRVRQMRAETRLKVKELRKSVVQRQGELRRLMFDPDASDTQIRESRSNLRKLQDQVDETNMNDLLAIRNMLTPEQRKRLPDCMPGRNATAGGGGAIGGNPPPAPPPSEFAAGLNPQSNDGFPARRKGN